MAVEVNKKNLDPIEGQIPMLQEDDNFFHKTGLDITWKKTWTMLCQPVSDANGEFLTFRIPSLSPNNYYFLQDMKIKLNLKLRDKDGKVLEKTDFISPVNNIGSSLFSDARLFLNETQVSAGTGGLYPFYSYLLYLLNYNTDKKDGYLSLQGFTNDTGADWDAPYAQKIRSGFDKRRCLFGHYEKDATTGAYVFTYNDDTLEPCTIIAPIITDFTAINRPIISNVQGRLELIRAPDRFYLMEKLEGNAAGTFETKKPKIIIESATLMIPVKEMNTSLNLKIEEHLVKKTLQYNTIRMDLRKYLIQANQSVYSCEDLKSSAISPDRMFIMFVPDSALNGKKGENPFAFRSFVKKGNDTETMARLISCKLCSNNESLESFDSHTATDTVIRKFMELNEVLGYTRGSSASLNFDEMHYAEYCFIIGYDLTLAKNSAILGQDIRGDRNDGNLKLDISFNQNLPESVWMMVLSEYHSGVSIDKNRNVVYKYFT